MTVVIFVIMHAQRKTRLSNLSFGLLHYAVHFVAYSFSTDNTMGSRRRWQVCHVFIVSELAVT